MGEGGAGGHVRRTRLTAVVDDNRVTVVEAGAGFGKSALAAECQDVVSAVAVITRLQPDDAHAEVFLARLKRACARAGLSDLASAVDVDDILDLLADTSEPVLLVLDDVHNVGAAVAAIVLELAAGLPVPHRLLLLGRTLPESARKLRYAHGVTWLSADDLAFAPDELAAVLDAWGVVGYAHSDAVRRATGGWPAAVVLAARQLARDGDTEAIEHVQDPRASVAELVQIVLGHLDANDRAAAVQLAHLPLLSPDVVATAFADEALWARVTAAGLPLGTRLGGGFELPGPVRDYLEGLGGIDAAVGHRAAGAYRDLGDTRSAIDVLIHAGDPAAAAAIISDLSRALWAPFEFAELAGLVESLPADAIDAHPRVLLYLARAAARADRYAHRFVALSRLEELAAGSSDPVLRDEVYIEIAYDLLRLRRAAEVPERIAGIDARLGSNQLHLRVQLLEVRGQYACRTDDYAEGERLLEEAKRLATQLGDRERAGIIAYRLATEVYFYAGRIDDALDAAKQSLAMHSAPLTRLGRVNLVADFATDLGAYEDAEAALREQAQLARQLRSERWTAYVPWGHARIASQQGDAERTVRAINDVLDNHASDQWFDSFEGTFFYADAADMLDRIGESAWARTCLASAADKYAGHPIPMIDAIIEARSGDPARAAEKFAALGDIRDNREQWRLELFRALAAFRRGGDDAGMLAADAFERAAADGLATAPMIRERAVSEQLVALAADAGSLLARELLAGDLPWTIAVLGPFEVRRGGMSVTLAPGKPTQAVKLLAASGGRLTIDEVIDALWPDQDLESGRRGVRNLLNRLKPSAPDLVQRDGSDLVLSPAVTVDADAFEAEARAALRTKPGDPGRWSAARAAMARYRGELLPSDRYESWAALPRERAQRRFGELVDLLIGEAEARSEIDEAVRLCEQAIDVDVYEERRYVRAARLLYDHGRRTHARAVVGRASAMLSDLGLQPSGELRDLTKLLAD